jgi:uncharacterized protein (TIRG00374 family)
MDMKIKKWLMILVSVIILFGIILYLNPARLAQTLYEADSVLIIYAFILSNFALLFRVLKWKSLLNNVSVKELAPVQFFGITASNLTPGKIGEPIKSMALKMVNGTPVSSSLSTVIWERIMDVLVMMIFGIVGMYFIAPPQYLPLIIAALGLFTALIIILLMVMYNEKFGRKFFSFFRKFPVMDKISDQFVSNFYSGTGISRKGFLLCFFWTFLAWLFDGLVFYAVFLSLEPSGIGITMPFILTCILSLSILVGLLSSLPGGAGGTEAVMIILLGAIGISGAVGGATVLVGRALTFGYSIVLGYFSFLYLGKKINLKELMKTIGL